MTCPKNKKVIYIIDEINSNISSELARDLMETDWKYIKEIDLYISSAGGFLSDCFAIVDLLQEKRKEYKIKINSFGLGDVASAGFFIFIIGDERKLYPNARVFVHSHVVIDGPERTYEERIRDDKTEEKQIYNNYVKYTAERLGISTRRTRALLRKKKWLSTKELNDYNILTKES